MAKHRRSRRHHAPARTFTVLAVAATGWLLTSATAVPSYAAAGGNGNGNANGLANAPGQLMKQPSSTPVATTPSATTSTTTATTTPSATSTQTTAPVVTGATVGDPTQPQPLSNADLNPGGANNGGNCGAYCSTRDGSASLNGNGNGQAVGKPCAGCVGKADNKNPQGQRPNGTDHNNGYECDGNNGIAKTNPAHTGCKPTIPGGCTVDCGGGDCTVNCGGDCTVNCGGDCTANCGGGGNCVTTNSCGGGVSNCATTHTCPVTPPGCVPTAANNYCSTVLGERQPRSHRIQVPPTAVLGEKIVRTPNRTPSRTPTSVLPFTGAPVIALLTLAGALVLFGGLTTRLGRRRGAHAAPRRL